MSDKKIVLMRTENGNQDFEQRLNRALEELGCDVAVCDAADAAQALDLLSEDRLPVVLK